MDELECFRRAAELGCEDFETLNSKTYCGIRMPDTITEHWSVVELPNQSARINRYSAAVCAEWWAKYRNERAQRCSDKGGRDILTQLIESDRMIYMAREFGRKYGGAW